MKSKEEIAKVLKEYRQRTGMSAKKVIEKLSLHDIKVSPKTLYGWESGHSQPDADTLLLLCNIYGIDDIMLAFGYSKTERQPIDTKTPEKAKLLNKVEQLDENNCKVVSAYIDGLLTKQGSRSRG
jgi:transcriptional regulator with XRE-family HTH domain